MHENFKLEGKPIISKQTINKIISNNNAGEKEEKKQITLSVLWGWEGT